MEYHIARSNEQLGVFDEDTVRKKLAAGEFLTSDLCWSAGMSEWAPLGSIIQSFEASQLNPYAPPISPIPLATSAERTAPLATLGQRFLGAILDNVIALLALVPITIWLIQTGLAAESGAATPPLSSTSFVLPLISAFLLLAVLVVNIILLAQFGQSIGKRIIGIRIVDLHSDEHPGFARVFLVRTVLNSILASLSIPGAIYSLVDICFIFGEERRCIHDLLASTRVVQGSGTPS